MTVSENLETELAIVDSLCEDGQIPEALTKLHELTTVFPGEVVVLKKMAEIASNHERIEHLLLAIPKLERLEPKNPDTMFVVAQAYGQSGLMELSRQAFKRFFELAEDFPQREELEEMLDNVFEDMYLSYKDLGLPADRFAELMGLHERTQIALNAYQFKETIRLALELLEICPRFTPARNNLSLAYFHTGEVDKAIDEAQYVLETQSDDVHALANIILFYLVKDSESKAKAFGGLLREVSVEDPETLHKKAHGLALIDDREGLFTLYKNSKKISECKDYYGYGEMLHLIAVANFRDKKSANAKKLWNEAVNWLVPSDYAASHLEDLENKPSERFGAWYVPAQDLIPIFIRPKFDEIADVFFEDKDDAKLKKLVLNLLKEFPYVFGIVRQLLNNSEPWGVRVGLIISANSDDRSYLNLVTEFLCGTHGSDNDRLHGLDLLLDKGFFQNSKSSFFIRNKGKLQPCDKFIY